jgi:hypothetical protein
MDHEMIGRLFLLTAFILIVFPANGFADSLNALPESITTAKAMALKPTADFPCKNAQFNQKKFRPEVIKDLPFPPGAFVELKSCDDAGLPEKPASTEEALKQEEIEKQKALEKLSTVLSYLYHQQNNLVGSYQETDQAYQDLLRKNLPNLKAYDQTASNYEDALKNLGEYEAYLSALPRAVSDYEKKMGSSLNGFVSQKADGVISLMKSPGVPNLSMLSSDLKSQKRDSDDSQEVPGESGEANEKGNRQGLCTAMGAVAGIGAAENIVLATLANPMGVLLGASLGATLCSETVYQKLAGWQGKLGEGLVEMGSYIKSGLSDIGNGLYHWGKNHLYQTPSSASEKIAEHYENTKDWLNRKLGWQ